MLISAVISTLVHFVSPTLSQFIFLSLLKYHQPITDDCSVVAYVTCPCSFLDIGEEKTDRKTEDNGEKWRLL